MNKPYIFGITGGIGSGKSRVGRLLAQTCASPLVDLDQCCRALLEPNQPGWLALRALFGAAYFHVNGALDRQALRNAIFTDPCLRHDVDCLIHPLARQRMRETIQHYRRQSVVLVEIPLLFEAGWQTEVDAVLVVYARKAIQCLRLMRRDGISRKAAGKAIAAQMSMQEKARLGQYLIDNSGDWEMTTMAVLTLAKSICPCSAASFVEEST